MSDVEMSDQPMPNEEMTGQESQEEQPQEVLGPGDDENDSHQIYKNHEIRRALGHLKSTGWGEGDTGWPTGYQPDVDPLERAEAQAALSNASIDYNRPATRRRLTVGPRDEPKGYDEGLTMSEAAARFPGKAVELAGEFDGEQTIVVASSSSSSSQTAKSRKDDDEDQRMGAEDSDEGEEIDSEQDDSEQDSDYDDSAASATKRPRTN